MAGRTRSRSASRTASYRRSTLAIQRSQTLIDRCDALANDGSVSNAPKGAVVQLQIHLKQWIGWLEQASEAALQMVTLTNPQAQQSMRNGGSRRYFYGHIKIAVLPRLASGVAAKDPCSMDGGLSGRPLTNQRCKLGWRVHGASFAQTGRATKKPPVGGSVAVVGARCSAACGS